MTPQVTSATRENPPEAKSEPRKTTLLTLSSSASPRSDITQSLSITPRSTVPSEVPSDIANDITSDVIDGSSRPGATKLSHKNTTKDELNDSEQQGSTSKKPLSEDTLENPHLQSLPYDAENEVDNEEDDNDSEKTQDGERNSKQAQSKDKVSKEGENLDQKASPAKKQEPSNRDIDENSQDSGKQTESNDQLNDNEPTEDDEPTDASEQTKDKHKTTARQRNKERSEQGINTQPPTLYRPKKRKAPNPPRPPPPKHPVRPPAPPDDNEESSTQRNNDAQKHTCPRGLSERSKDSKWTTLINAETGSTTQILDAKDDENNQKQQQQEKQKQRLSGPTYINAQTLKVEPTREEVREEIMVTQSTQHLGHYGNRHLKDG